MGVRGPLPKLKVVDGVFQPPKNTPRPKPSLPSCPSWVSTEGRAEWKRVAKPLFNLGLLTELDRQTLAMYCETVGRYQRAEADLAREGAVYETPGGFLKQRPEYYIMRDALQELRAFIALFGLSPAGRMRMQLPEPAEDDELADLLDKAK